ncbi:hypothetical protein AVEN_165128-1 [Araneus ventricosus]|uniref:RNase H type-1 domain-containing protein n=1 Tax=Araneus ventricosus TaxID=182803 RepID=A0A4Y2B891_ARAVE|nr:hypothetical protein AVEN_165128-1 [Araneus ventricosus]
MKVLSNTSWEASRTSLLRVDRASILSKMDYGCVIYGSARQSVLKKLDPIHHSALRLCSGAFRTSPVENGSKCSSCTSFACVFINSTLSFQLHPSCSIFTAEITAILHALSQISSGPPDNYIIYSDSLSALKSMTSLNRFSHPLTFNILELHERLGTKGFTILFCWIPSHVGISGNELADNLARSATNSLSSPVPLDDVKKCIKSILHSKWQAQWDLKNTNFYQSNA